MNLYLFFAFHNMVCACRCQLLGTFNAPMVDSQNAPLTATINTSSISTAILRSLESPVITLITSTVEKQIALNMDAVRDLIKDAETRSNSELKSLQETVRNEVNNMKEINKKLKTMQVDINGSKEKVLNNDELLQEAENRIKDFYNSQFKLLTETVRNKENDLTEINKKLETLQAENIEIKQKIDIVLSKHLPDCVYIDKRKSSGIYTIFPGNSTEGVKVFCDMDVDGGGWTVFQRRMDGSTDFYKGWTEYENGFGDLQKEFWLGNSNLHTITSQGKYELRIDLEDFENNTRFAKYTTFAVADKLTNYRLTVDGYNGDAGDSLSPHRGSAFSTKDRDNDGDSSNCAQEFKGGWWYFTGCLYSNLNALYLKGKHSSLADGINWKHWKGYKYSLKSTTMMTRKVK